MGIVLIILRHLPEAAASHPAQVDPLAQKITLKGLPWLDIPKFRAYFKRQTQRLWHFLLEAKDLRPSGVVGYRVKKIFGRNAVSASEQPTSTFQTPSAEEEITEPDEDYFLEKIKTDPKNLQLYNELGKFYLDHGQPSDARDIFQYLIKHNMTNAEYYARLAQAQYKLKDFAAAVENYSQSLAIDPAQPNRLYNKGVCQEALEQFEDASATYKLAIALEPKNLKFYTTLAHTLQRVGDRVAAKSVLLKAQKLEPFNTEIAEKLKTV